MSIVEEHFPRSRDEVVGALDVPIVGSFCAYVPEEVIHACGAHPVHLDAQGTSGGAAEASLPPNLCPYVRRCFDWGMGPEARRLQGVVFTDSCNAMQRLRDVWERVETPFTHLLDVPRIRTDGSERFYARGIQTFGARLAAFLGRPGWEAELPGSIRLFDRTRDLLSRLARLRRAGEVELLESEHLQLLQIARYWPRADLNARIEALVAALEARGGPGAAPRARLLLTGSMSVSAEIVSLIESTGARVVHADLCTTSRYYEKGRSFADGDPARHLAALYLEQIPCARMKDATIRMQHLLERIEETRADGVVYSVPQFCDTFLFEYSVLRRWLEARGVPDLLIESDYTANNAGQLRTKIEAFVEVLSA